MNSLQPLDDFRPEVTKTIWRYGVFMLLISIPSAVFVKGLMILPFIVVFGAVVASASVWLFGNVSREKESSLQMQSLAKRVADLDERLGHIETLSRVELRMAEREPAQND